PLLAAADADRRERRGLLDGDLPGLPQLEQREQRHGLLHTRKPSRLLVEVEPAPAPQQRAEPRQELLDRREAQLEVRERDLPRQRRQRSQRLAQTLRPLRRQLTRGRRRERRRPEPEEARALRFEPLREPGGTGLRAPVLGEPPGELVGCLLRLELVELRGLVREEPARLELEQRRDEHEEVAARL